MFNTGINICAIFIFTYTLLITFILCYVISFQMMAKFAEDDRIEQMNAQKRRMKQLEHKRAVEQLLADRREQFAADRVCKDL